MKSAQELAQRFREVKGIRFYVEERLALLLAANLVIGLISVACAIGVVVFLANMQSLLARLGVLLMFTKPANG